MKKRHYFFLSIIGCTLYILTCLSPPYSSNFRDRSFSNQVAYINDRLIEGAADDLQDQYPEGYNFANALFALSLIEANDNRYCPIIDRCIDNLISDKAKSTFEFKSWNQYGAFYNGWVGFTLKQYINSPIFENSSIPSKTFVEHSKLTFGIQRALKDSCSLLETYSGLIWPGDNFACMASLDSATIRPLGICLDSTLYKNIDTDGLYYHFINKNPISRGSSQALITFFMSKFNLDRAKVYNDTFKREFEAAFFTIDFIKEYKDSHSKEDIDSGPIIKGIGSVATIMNVKTQSALGYVSRPTWAALNLAGFPINVFGKKRYLFGHKLMFDIFMLWTSSSLDRTSPNS